MRRDTHQAIHGPYDDAKQQWMLRTGRCFPQTQTCFSGSSYDCDIVVHEGSLALMGREECSNFERDRLMEQLGQSEPRKGVCELRTRLMPLLLREIASANMLRKLFVTVLRKLMVLCHFVLTLGRPLQSEHTTAKTRKF
jgi:hypothetical protein